MVSKDAVTRRNQSLIRSLSILAILTSAIVAMRFLPLERFRDSLAQWLLDHGMWGWPAFAIIYALLTVALIPGALLTLMAGALFGLGLGFVLASIGSTTGAAVAFLIARYVARRRVERVAKQYASFEAIDQAIGEGGWKVVILTRLSPVIPFNAQNYLYGVTRIGFWPYVFASWVGMMPGTLMYVYFGHVAGLTGASGESRSITDWLILLVGLVATIAVTVYVTRLARGKLALLKSKGPVVDSSHTPAPLGHRERLATASYVILAALAITLSVVTVFRGDNLVSDVKSWMGIGPPQVVMRESYRPNPNGPKVDHSILDRLLGQHVTDTGWIDYGGVQANEEELDAYLEVLAEAPFDELGRNQKLALLINAYNAFTLKLIAEHYPIASIKDIPAGDRWNAERWKIGGEVLSLSQIEHEQIRPHFKEPRIHFALVCAAVGCPPLLNEAYEAERIDEQLERQTRFVFDHETWLKVDTTQSTLSVTPLLDWYRGDFEQEAGSLTNYLAIVSPQAKAMIEQGRKPNLTFLKYDWKLNGIENQSAR